MLLPRLKLDKFLFAETTTEDPTQNEIVGKIVFFQSLGKLKDTSSCIHFQSMCFVSKMMNVIFMLLSASYPGSLTLNQPFTPELSNPNTPEFQEAENNFCSQVTFPLVTLEKCTLLVYCF